jgi:hypothetical protein
MRRRSLRCPGKAERSRLETLFHDAKSRAVPKKALPEDQ